MKEFRLRPILLLVCSVSVFGLGAPVAFGQSTTNVHTHIHKHSPSHENVHKHVHSHADGSDHTSADDNMHGHDGDGHSVSLIESCNPRRTTVVSSSVGSDGERLEIELVRIRFEGGIRNFFPEFSMSNTRLVLNDSEFPGVSHVFVQLENGDQGRTFPVDLDSACDSPIEPSITVVDPVITDVDPQRSIFVTDEAITQAFSLEAVLDNLRGQVPSVTTTTSDMWRQLWDTQNAGPGLGLGPNCDAEIVDGVPSINNFPIECERNEGIEVNSLPFDSTQASFYMPIGIVNRFDLASEDGSSCGQYRIIFARKSGQTNGGQRNLVIFEAEMPNPHGSCGIDGCQDIAKFWASLSAEGDVTVRAQMLRDFYLDGLPEVGVPPVISVDHFAPGRGQIRTNQFLNIGQNVSWQLREFQLLFGCDGSGGNCELKFSPTSVADNPYGPLFSDQTLSPSIEPLRASFQATFPENVESLASNDLTQMHMALGDSFNAGQSTIGSENNYARFFDNRGGFADAISTNIPVASGLTPTNIVDRATTQSCAGCHQLSANADLGDGVRWPSSLGFVHVAESNPQAGPDGLKFRISPALRDVFVPHRERILENYLENVGECLAPATLAITTETETQTRTSNRDATGAKREARVSRRGSKTLKREARAAKHKAKALRLKVNRSGKLEFPQAGQTKRIDAARRKHRTSKTIGGTSKRH